MNITESLKTAVETQDWSLVKDVYKTLTGTDIEQNIVEKPLPKTKRKYVKKTATAPNAPEPIKPTFVNKFVDDYTLGLKELKEYKKQKNKTPTPRTRPPVEYVQATCKKCGTKKTVNKIEVTIRKVGDPGDEEEQNASGWVCNTCSCGPRG